MWTTKTAVRTVIFLALLVGWSANAWADYYYQITLTAEPPAGSGNPAITFTPHTLSRVDDGTARALVAPVVVYGMHFETISYSSGEYVLTCTGTPADPNVSITIPIGLLLVDGDAEANFGGTTVKEGESQEYTTSSMIELFEPDPPPLVTIAGMRAELRGPGVIVSWETASEVDTAGFRVLRSHEGGDYTVVTESMIPAEGGTAVPAAYSWTDYDVRLGRYSYLIQEVEISGKTNDYGPVGVVIPAARRSYR